MRLAQQRRRCSSNTRPHNPGSHNHRPNRASYNLGRCSMLRPDEAGRPGADQARTGAAGEAVERAKLRTGAWFKRAGKLAAWSSPPAELLDHLGAARFARLSVRSCGPGAVEWPPACQLYGTRSCRGRPGSCQQSSNQGRRRARCVASCAWKLLNRGRFRAGCVAQGPGADRVRPRRRGRVSCWSPGS